MGLPEIAQRVKQFIAGEVSAEQKNQAFDTIEKTTGVKIDEQQRKAMIKANVPVDKLITAFTLRQIQSAASNARAGGLIGEMQDGGFSEIQNQMPGGGSISQGGVTATIPASREYKTREAILDQQAKSAQEKEKKSLVAEETSKGTYRFLQQFNRSYEELKAFDPEVDAIGVGGFLTRKTAKLAEFLDELPETKTLKTEVLPMANEIAREVEGGKVTDQDRKIYADRFASAINFPTKTNVRLMSNQIINLIDKGGDKNGAITNQLKQLVSTKSDIFNSVVEQVIIEFPDMAKKLFGDDFEVSQ